ncbi:MAG: hypothetical protein Tp1111SUR761211_43 [Prokaryotic dsDNA virus sp.]|nr:MAG: hypothetical protein Tp1111SUR761211_43 [Prokaryotic dsDNA virus sp.]|tara:strand:- start:1048 stop:1224 length:177 start_codon:yes stop_codon:yes gene_type:complete
MVIYKVHLKQKDMIQNILDLLEFARSEKWNGQYIDIAMGKNKYPESIREAYKQFKKWQ